MLILKALVKENCIESQNKNVLSKQVEWSFQGDMG